MLLNCQNWAEVLMYLLSELKVCFWKIPQTLIVVCMYIFIYILYIKPRHFLNTHADTPWYSLYRCHGAHVAFNPVMQLSIICVLLQSIVGSIHARPYSCVWRNFGVYSFNDSRWESSKSYGIHSYPYFYCSQGLSTALHLSASDFALHASLTPSCHRV